jgi:beta-glucosidase
LPVRAIHQFPRPFLWGCATAAHQVEGQNVNDWWRWEQEPKHIYANQRAGRAADWWAGRFTEDFDRAVDLHNNAIRLSIEWSRIQPEPDRWDNWTLDRYREMLLALHDRGLTPMITLHHFTHPLWIADRDSWAWEKTPEHFEIYVRKVVDALGDLCSLWCTINEPMTLLTDGYLRGDWPPGKHARNAALQAGLNLVKGHVRAYHTIKALQPKSQVGFSCAAAPRYDHNVMERLVQMGEYKTLLQRYAFAEAKQATDWVGLQGAISPQAIKRRVAGLYVAYKKPIYLTSLGEAEGAAPPSHFIEVMRALWLTVNFNYPVQGVFIRSLIDGFEWEQGYNPAARFGLYGVDFETQERTPRPRAAIYTDICRRNGVSSEIVEKHAPELMSKLFPGEAGQNNVTLKQRTRQE